MSEVYDYWSKEDWIKHVGELEEERDSYQQQLKDADEEIQQLKERCEIANTQRKFYGSKAEERRDMLEDVVNVLDLSDEAVATHGQQGTAPAVLVRLALDERDRALDNDYKTRKIQQLETQLSGRTHHHDNPRIEEENEKLTAQVAVLRGILSVDLNSALEDLIEVGYTIEQLPEQFRLLTEAYLKVNTNDKAEKMLEVVKAAERMQASHGDCYQAQAGAERLLMEAVKAYKGE